MRTTNNDGTTGGGMQSESKGGGEGAGEDGGQHIDDHSEAGLERGLEGSKSLPAMLRGMLEKVESKIGAGDLKALGDYLKLVQMLKELEENEPKEIRVTWTEPPPGSSSEK
ncbi:MAG TPA: hypothetical protein VN841_22415 [Bryobacteraceae bacterium]|nr:hypothetical protein [Bryobacteraceae bacterium]